MSSQYAVMESAVKQNSQLGMTVAILGAKKSNVDGKYGGIQVDDASPVKV